jgi:hypothetical protein
MPVFALDFFYSNLKYGKVCRLLRLLSTPNIVISVTVFDSSNTANCVSCTMDSLPNRRMDIEKAKGMMHSLGLSNIPALAASESCTYKTTGLS